MSNLFARWKRKKEERSNRDLSIPFVTIGLALFGVLMVYSSSQYIAKTQYGDRFFFAKKQLFGVVVGIVVFFLMGKIPIQFLKNQKFCWIFYGVSLLLLSLVFVPGIGKSNYGATRWIGFGGFTIQPSEIAKYSLVLLVSAILSKDMGKARTVKRVIPVLLSGGIVCVLIMLEPNMSVTMCVGIVLIAMLFLGGAKMGFFIAVGIPLLIAVPVLIAIEPYRLSRLSAFLDPFASPKEEGYQLIQSLYALGNGGWFGVGLFESRQKYLFLPFAESDFILSIIGEEFGFFGIIVLLSTSFFLIYKGIRIALRAEGFFEYLLAMGITLVYGTQTLINGLVVSGGIPPTGIPLPLISSGNTSIIITMAGMGVLYRLSKSTKEGKNSYNRT